MGTFKMIRERSAEDSVFDRQQRIAWWSQERLRQAKVMVVGAGAIGNEVLKNLALLGVGYIFVVDFDTISNSNLSRTVLFRPEDVGQSKSEVAAQRLRGLFLEPSAAIDTFHGDLVWDLGTGVFRQMDLVLGCVDNVEARLAINRQCHLAGIPWIDAGIHELAGHLSVFVPPEGGCYECAASPQQLASARVRYSCDNFKRRLATEGRAATVQVASALVASLQVQEAIKLLHGRRHMAGKSLLFQGTINDFDTIQLPFVEECMAHAFYPEVESLDLSTEVSLETLLRHLEEVVEEAVTLDWSDDRAFILRLRCRGCQDWVAVHQPEFRIFDSDTYCARCAAQGVPDGSVDDGQDVPTDKEALSRFDLRSTPAEVLALSLRDLGCPLLPVLPVLSESGTHRYFELTGDEAVCLPGLRHEAEHQDRSDLDDSQKEQ